MEVITLRCTKKNSYNNKNAEFHFKDLDAANKFIYTFKDHWCHVDFDKLIEDKYETKELIEELNEDPELYAENSLSWGFNLARHYGDDKTTLEEQNFIKKIMEINNRR